MLLEALTLVPASSRRARPGPGCWRRWPTPRCAWPTSRPVPTTPPRPSSAARAAGARRRRRTRRSRWASPCASSTAARRGSRRSARASSRHARSVTAPSRCARTSTSPTPWRAAAGTSRRPTSPARACATPRSTAPSGSSAPTCRQPGRAAAAAGGVGGGRAHRCDRIEDGRERFFASTLLELLAQLALFRGELELARTGCGRRWSCSAVTTIRSSRCRSRSSGPRSRAARETRRGGWPSSRRPTASEPTTWPRYRWPLLWEAARCLADLRTRAGRPSRGAVRGGRRLGRAMGGAARRAGAGHAAHARLCRALRAPRLRTRLGGRLAAWSDAVDATRRAEDPYLVAHALHRRAEAAIAGGDRESAVVDLRESLAARGTARGRATRHGGRAARPAGSARPRRLGETGGEGPAGRTTSSAGSGSPSASATSWLTSRPGARTRRSPGTCSSARRP